MGLGVDNGTDIRLAGQGNAGTRGGPAGHLYVHVEVTPSPVFTRKGSDVFIDQKISIAQVKKKQRDAKRDSYVTNTELC